jgi:hypothetical protein
MLMTLIIVNLKKATIRIIQTSMEMNSLSERDRLGNLVP